VYNGDITVVDHVAFLAWSTPRAPDFALEAPLRAAGIEVRLVGDAKCARDVLSATAEGYAVGSTI
jgi:dimethylglycine catabolism A